MSLDGGALPTRAELLQAGAFLLGLSAPATSSAPARPAKKDLATVLDTRLSCFRSLSALWPAERSLPGGPSQAEPSSSATQHQTPTSTSTSLQTQTAKAATRIFKLLVARLDESPSAPTPSASSAGVPPVFGQRDHQVIAQLAAVIARWGISALVRPGTLPRGLTGTAPECAPSPAARFAEVDEVADAREREAESRKERELELLTRLLLDVTLPDPSAGEGRKELASMVRLQVALPLVGALVQLGYGGTSSAGDWARKELDEMFKRTTPTQVLATLLSLLSASAVPSQAATASQTPSLRPSLSRLLSEQLTRPGGVRALLVVVVGSEEDVGVRKLEMVTRLLVSGVRDSTKSPEERTTYLGVIVPQLMDVLASTARATVDRTSSGGRNVAPEGVLRAASFVLTDFVSRDLHGALDLIRTSLHQPFTLEQIRDDVSPLVALTALSLLISHAPPTSPPALLLSTLITPIVPALFSLDAFLREDLAPGISVLGESSAKGKGKANADDQLKDELSAVLETWAKSVLSEEAVRAIGKAVEQLEGSDQIDVAAWTRAASGEVKSSTKRERASDSDEEGSEPDFEPERLVVWLQLVNRKGLSGALFVRWLDELQVLRATPGLEAAKRSVVRLQLVLKMVQDMGSDILNQEPSHIISFVAHALEVKQPAAAPSAQEKKKEEDKPSAGLTLDDLRIVQDEPEQAAVEEQDEDVEGLGLDGDELVVTGLTLLLAVLEGHPQLTIASTPLLGLIYDRLSAISAHAKSELVPPLAQEARMVLSARQASSLATDTKAADPNDPLAESRATYQGALVLLQDALLPVRAQGLAQLKQLVGSDDAILKTDPALIPAVLDIFLQAVEDDDSFLYLSAVQGLSGLVDTQGVGIVRRLVRVYVGGVGTGKIADVRETGTGEKGRRELERRLRVGEALGQVVARAGESLARFVDDLIPALLATLREHTLPTTLRASALTLLAQSLETAPLALLAYADDLGEACLTLLSLESVPLKAKITPVKEEDLPVGKDGKQRRPEETPDPTGADAKTQPSLRRAAVLLLGLLFRSAASLNEQEMDKRVDAANEIQIEGLLGGGLRMPTGRRIEISAGGVNGSRRGGLTGEIGQEDGGWKGLVNVGTKARARAVLDFVRQTDEDSLVRHQAGEVLAELGQAEKDPASLIRML